MCKMKYVQFMAQYWSTCFKPVSVTNCNSYQNVIFNFSFLIVYSMHEIYIHLKQDIIELFASLQAWLAEDFFSDFGRISWMDKTAVEAFPQNMHCF